MTFVAHYHLTAKRRHPLLLAAFAVLLTGCLTGCNVEPHDALDSRTPANMPVPESAKTTVAPPPSRPAPPTPTEADLGMPVYPNATLYVDSMGQSVPSLTVGDSKQAVLSTPDSMDKVIAFYKSKLSETEANGSSKPVTPVERAENGKRSMVLTGNDAQGNIMMAILHEESGKIVMELMHTHTAVLPTSVSGGTKSDSARPEAKTPSSSAPAPASSPSAQPSRPTTGLPSSPSTTP